MNVTREAANTRRMREHQLTKRQDNSITHEEVDLGVVTTVIDYSTSALLNARPSSAGLLDVIQGGVDCKPLISDADEQIIMKISFKDPCTITAVIIRADEAPEVSEGEEVSGPKSLKFYSNREDLDFSEVEDFPPAQTAELKKDEGKVVLRGNKFQRVNSVQIFTVSNQNDTPLTYINQLSLRGFVCPPYTQQHMK
eukprot:Gregarina_sp_Poly_1__4671@NODE_2497_length_2057_cov_184_027136_g1586_i0_p2_GENE_NODE_2497_length_2057_cov_184_027136_g1586_i0NODE_2497_length_2057_cov_184_027136_g1586_i0_p2_ORF_typecomplete_len196_score23_07PITH/PF06201_13/7_4e28_NODE_2497_length_2057_cov_184_027136_g1586_i013421929